MMGCAFEAVGKACNLHANSWSCCAVVAAGMGRASCGLYVKPRSQRCERILVKPSVWSAMGCARRRARMTGAGVVGKGRRMAGGCGVRPSGSGLRLRRRMLPRAETRQERAHARRGWDGDGPVTVDARDSSNGRESRANGGQGLCVAEGATGRAGRSGVSVAATWVQQDGQRSLRAWARGIAGRMTVSAARKSREREGVTVLRLRGHTGAFGAGSLAGRAGLAPIASGKGARASCFFNHSQLKAEMSRKG
ncbi:hypothetical protein DFH09DRAFT_1128395 [Mycena vulgaris]|nr:hypothetical protein DFH09DRAFT_1128395 [Mycena vulgaris]